jgi:hypothetical protein
MVKKKSTIPNNALGFWDPDYQYHRSLYYKDISHPCAHPYAERLKAEAYRLQSFFECLDGFFEYPWQWSMFLDMACAIAAHFNLDASKSYRAKKQKQRKLLDSIAKTARELSQLLDEFHRESEGSMYSVNTIFHDPIFLLMETMQDEKVMKTQKHASESPEYYEKFYKPGLYDEWIRPKFSEISSFDTRYYPDTTEMLDHLANEVDRAELIPEYGFECLETRKTSRLDFERALLEAIEKERVKAKNGNIWTWIEPCPEFSLSNAALTDLEAVLLDTESADDTIKRRRDIKPRKPRKGTIQR